MSVSTLIADPQTVAKAMRDLGNTRTTPMGRRIPGSASPIQVIGTAQPAIYGTQVQMAEYTVAVNWVAVICGIVLGYESAGAAPLPGDLTFTVDIDRPLGVTGVGYTEKNFANVPVRLGSFWPYGPWPVDFEHSSGEHIRVKGTAVQTVALGAGSFLTAALIGWSWPAQGWE